MSRYSNEICTKCNVAVHPINGEICGKCGEFFCRPCYEKHKKERCKKTISKKISEFFGR